MTSDLTDSFFCVIIILYMFFLGRKIMKKIASVFAVLSILFGCLVFVPNARAATLNIDFSQVDKQGLIDLEACFNDPLLGSKSSGCAAAIKAASNSNNDDDMDLTDLLIGGAILVGSILIESLL